MTKKTSKQRKKISIDFVLIIVGIIILLLLSIYRFWTKRILSFSVVPPKVESTTSKPVKIKISNRVTLKVVEGKIASGVWSISDVYANHLDISSNPGDGGNIVIYAHNKKNMFGPLLWVSKDESIILENEKGESYKYRISDIKEVNSNEISYISPKDKEVLTLYTCTGMFDSKRLIVSAYPEK